MAADRRPDNMERITTPALADAFIEEQVKEIKEQVGDKKVLLALSGGVDSSVVAALLIKAIGGQLTCVHVNHGLLRKGEPEQVIEVFQNQMKANLVYVDATDRFLDKLAGVTDPETKRKIIGGEFIEVFAEEARKLDGIEFLAQGTIWPDILESEEGIKAHHNAGGLPEDMNFELVEPVKILFKDEVRVVGKQLGLPDNMVYRQPFPGPGLGVRCPGAITRDRLEAVRESDAILREEFAKNGLEGKVWQYFTVVPDFKSTGVKDGKRAFEWSVIIRAVNTTDAMSATVENIPFDLMCHLVDRITKEVPGVNRVLYDFTPKPCGTIDWVSSVFTDVESEMKGLPWGEYYEKYHTNSYNPQDVHDKLQALYSDYYVKSRKGVYEYILGGCVDTKLLDVRIFDDVTKKTVYKQQTADAERDNKSNCPLCAIGNDNNAKRIYKLSEMDADHVTAWSNGGATDISNCTMLCKTHNRAKGNK